MATESVRLDAAHHPTCQLSSLKMIVVAAAVVLLVRCASSGDEPPSVGDALEVAPSHVAAVRPGDAGSSFTEGLDVVRLVADEPVTITEIRSVGGETALHYEGAYIAGPDRRVGAIQLLDGFPPSDPGLGAVAPAEGYVLDDDSHMGYELLLGYTWVGAERTARETIEVHYESEGQSFVQSIPAAFVVCPRGESTASCTQEWR